jgi:hypothetical protein
MRLVRLLPECVRTSAADHEPTVAWAPFRHCKHRIDSVVENGNELITLREVSWPTSMLPSSPENLYGFSLLTKSSSVSLYPLVLLFV